MISSLAVTIFQSTGCHHQCESHQILQPAENLIVKAERWARMRDDVFVVDFSFIDVYCYYNDGFLCRRSSAGGLCYSRPQMHLASKSSVDSVEFDRQVHVTNLLSNYYLLHFADIRWCQMFLIVLQSHRPRYRLRHPPIHHCWSTVPYSIEIPPQTRIAIFLRNLPFTSAYFCDF